MRAFGRFIGSFILLLAIGYIAMVAFLPAAPSAADDLRSGRSVAVQLSEQAGALISRKPDANH